jgi:type II secretory pathway component PulF
MTRKNKVTGALAFPILVLLFAVGWFLIWLSGKL